MRPTTSLAIQSPVMPRAWTHVFSSRVDLSRSDEKGGTALRTVDALPWSQARVTSLDLISRYAATTAGSHPVFDARCGARRKSSMRVALSIAWSDANAVAMACPSADMMSSSCWNSRGV